MNVKLRTIILNNRFLNIIAFKIYPILGAIIISENCIDAANQLNSRSDESFYVKDLAKETIEKLTAKEAERKKTIEDKAKTNVTAVTIAIALVTTILTVINGANTYSYFSNHPLTVYLILIFIIGFIYLVISGFSAFRALQLNVVYDLYLNDEIQLVGKSEESRNGRMIKNLELNYVGTPQREAYVTASYQAMKNGLYALVSFVLLGMIIFISGEPSSKSVINKVHPIKIQILEVVDANTLKIKAEQVNEVVQLAYISSPSHLKEESYGKVAFEAVKEVVANEQLEMEIVNYQNDKKEVLVYLGGDRTLNEYLIENGLARAVFPDKEDEIFKAFSYKQSEAKEKKLGMWKGTHD